MTATVGMGTAARETADEAEGPRPFELSSYSHLLRFPVAAPIGRDGKAAGHPGAVRAVDAIVVPTVRPAEQLRSAVDLAASLRCRLVVLYTDRLPDGLSSVLAKLQPGMATAVALSSGTEHRRLDLGLDIPQSLVSGCARDISRKRNLGLLIGRACNWTSMLFLDDDIRRINAEKLHRAAALMGRYPVVGLQVKKFPDASVVGHARRLNGHCTEPFISGGSLLVDPQRLHGFFPAVYHEDWFCLINNLRLGEVAIGGSVAQLPYRPFTTPERARLEEFGDILVSGLLWLVHAAAKASAGKVTGQPVTPREYWQAAAKPGFWDDILVQRFVLLGSIIERLRVMNAHRADTARMGSVIASWERCGELSAQEFVVFVDGWLDGLDTWRSRMAGVPPVDSVDQALADLGLCRQVHPDEPGDCRPRAAARGPRALARAARDVSGRCGTARERLRRSG